MEKSDFLNEVLNSDICPDNFQSIYKKFNEYQNQVMRTLIEFHRVCEKNGIRYQLAFGSLLGAVRDDGQIPWDYDVDVFVFYDDKARLILALKKDLDKQFYFYCPENEPKCRHVIMRLAPKGFRSEGIHVDVFYLIGAPDDIKQRKKHMSNIKRLANARFDKLVNIQEESTNWKSFIKLFIGKIRTIGILVDRNQQKYEELCSKYEISSSEILIEADTFADWYEFPKEIMCETKLYSTSLGEFRIPVRYEEVLKVKYGNYNNILPLEKRIEELVSHYKRLVKFETK